MYLRAHINIIYIYTYTYTYTCVCARAVKTAAKQSMHKLPTMLTTPQERGGFSESDRDGWV